MRIFLDSSALAKRYVEEPGTETVLRRCRDAEEIVLSVLCIPETISGFNRLRREGALGIARYRALKRALAADLEAVELVDLAPPVLERAILCLERAPLRALDAVQVASAIEAGCDLFLTADFKQNEAASHLHLKTEYVGENRA